MESDDQEIDYEEALSHQGGSAGNGASTNGAASATFESYMQRIADAQISLSGLR